MIKIKSFGRYIVKQIHSHKVVAAVITVISVAAITMLVLYVVIPTVKMSIKSAVKSTKPGPSVVLSSEAETKLQSKSPADGPLQYEYLMTYKISDDSSPKFIYFTTERRDERLIELNEQIINDLKNTGKITEQTDSYSIDYFNDKNVAKRYFTDVNDPKTTVEGKLRLKESYIASMAYAKNVGLNMLISISTAKIIKKY